jgi:hypothetical protein
MALILTDPADNLSIEIIAVAGAKSKLEWRSEYTVGGLAGTVNVDYEVFNTLTED